MSEHIHHVTDDNFDAEVLQSPTPVLLDYWAEWCGPCKMIAPVLDQVAQEYAGRLKAPREELLASLQGELSEAHLFVARMIRQHIATLQTQLADLEHRLFDELKPYEAAVQLLLTIPPCAGVIAQVSTTRNVTMYSPCGIRTPATGSGASETKRSS